LEDIIKNKYIFIQRYTNDKKKITNFNTIHPVKNMLDDLFLDNSNTYKILMDSTEYAFEFQKKKSNGFIYYFEFLVDYTPQLSARILDEIHNKLTKGEHRKDYKIVISYSGSSEYYCNKLYPYLNTFERRIRDMIFLIVTENFGIDWFVVTTKNGLDKTIKSKKDTDNNKLVENALYEMTIGQLEEYLFTEWRDINAETFLDEELIIKKIDHLSKEELIQKVKSNEKKSLWQRIFEDQININNIREKISRVRNCRNDVAHSKLIEYETFSKNKKLLKILNKELEQACNLLVENEEINRNIFNALKQFKKTYMDICNISEATVISITESLSKISDAVNTSGINDAIKSYGVMTKKISEMYLNQLNQDSGDE